MTLPACPVCARPFQPVKKGQIYCSVKCCKRALYRKEREMLESDGRPLTPAFIAAFKAEWERKKNLPRPHNAPPSLLLGVPVPQPPQEARRNEEDTDAEQATGRRIRGASGTVTGACGSKRCALTGCRYGGCVVGTADLRRDWTKT